MGREDIDALMLGNGRPFVIEAQEPHLRKFDLNELERMVNQQNTGVIEVEGLSWSDARTVVGIKDAKSRKIYRVVIGLEMEPTKEKLYKAASNFSNLQISQQTPQRVAHRRADIERKRTIISFEIESAQDKQVTAVIVSESGTYIKELIHGDHGRTRPNFSEELGMDCKVISLDVIKVLDKET
jgi:tRNA pseudouridine synthase 10